MFRSRHIIRAVSRLSSTSDFSVISSPYATSRFLTHQHQHHRNYILTDHQCYHFLARARPTICNHPQFDYFNRSFFNFGKKRFHDPNPDAAEAERLITSLTNPSGDHPDIQTAARLAKKAVDEGDSPRGKTLLGSLYREGFCVNKNLEEAERLFLEASEAGDPIAQCSLGVLKLTNLKSENSQQPHLDMAVAVDEEGKYVASRVEPIQEDIETNGKDVEAVDKNIETEVMNETNKKKKKIETPADLVRKVRKERKKAGFTDAQAPEFEEYKQMEKEKRQKLIREDAHKWLELAIDQDNEQAILALANDLVMDNAERAVELFELASKKYRNVDAYYTLGQIYERGVGNINRDLRASFRCFSMGAQLGDASAQLYMGCLYHRGSFITEVDTNLARQYIEMAVKQKHPSALNYYALMHRTGDCDVEENQEKFLEYMFKSIESVEYGPSLSILADIHYQGSDGVETNYEKALEYFHRAGKVGEVEAICSEAAMYFHGTGVKQDQRKAFELYQDAAMKGSVNALRNLSSMYFYGHGVPVNRSISEHFMNVADEMEKERKSNAENKDMENQGSKEEGMEIITEEAPKVQGLVERMGQISAPSKGKEQKASETVKGG